MAPTIPSAISDHDQALLDRWLSGDDTAFTELVRRHAGLVHRACHRQLGSTDADDATQAVFLVLSRKGRLAAGAPVLEAWLLAVARRVCANATRARRRRLRHEQESTAMGTARQHDRASPVIPLEVNRYLDEALAGLPSHERDAIVAHYLGGLSQTDLARRCGCPEGTINARAHRGIRRLRDWFAKRGHGITTGAVLAILLAEHGAAAAESVTAADLLVRRDSPAPTSSGALAAPSASALDWSQTTISDLTMTRTLPIAVALCLVALTGASWGLLATRSIRTGAVAPPSFLDLATQFPAPVRLVYAMDIPRDDHSLTGFGDHTEALILSSELPGFRSRMEDRLRSGGFSLGAYSLPYAPKPPSEEHWEDDGPGMKCTVGGVTIAQLRWLVGGQGLRITPPIWTDMPLMAWGASCRDSLRAMPTDAWFRLVGLPQAYPFLTTRDTKGMTAWIGNSGRFEICFATLPAVTEQRAAEWRAQLPLMQAMFNTTLTAIPPDSSTRGHASGKFVDSFLAAIDNALQSAVVKAEPRGVVISGTSDAKIIQEQFLPLLKSIQ